MAAFWDNETMVGKIAKNSREEIHVKQVEKGGRQYVDIRVFWLDNNSNEYRPSQKGVTIPRENFEEFKSIIDDVK